MNIVADHCPIAIAIGLTFCTIDFQNLLFLMLKRDDYYYGSQTNDIPCTPALLLQNGQKMQVVKSCTHIGNKLCPHYNILVDKAVNDLNYKLNNPLADFSHCNSRTFTVLF